MKRLVIALTGLVSFALMAVAAGNGVAFGKGMIPIADSPDSRGIFHFHAASLNGKVRGHLDFMEVKLTDPRRMTVVHNLRVKVERFTCERKTAKFAGPALFNGKRAFAEAYVEDRWHPGSPLDIVDYFEVLVFSPDGNELYRAGGPLLRGDIVVRCAPPGR